MEEIYVWLHQRHPQPIDAQPKADLDAGRASTTAMARLQLGRAFALLGDKNKAKAAYQDFLKLWQGADVGIPILNQAKMEYVRL